LHVAASSIELQHLETLVGLHPFRCVGLEPCGAFRLEMRKQAKIAIDESMKFGKGRNPAGLNFGDLFAYALAKLRDEPLLFKGDDFSKTDIESAS
jgi:hypothetical protein